MSSVLRKFLGNHSGSRGAPRSRTWASGSSRVGTDSPGPRLPQPPSTASPSAGCTRRDLLPPAPWAPAHPDLSVCPWPLWTQGPTADQPGAPRPPRRPAAPASPQAPGPTATTGGPRRSGSARRVLNMPNQRGGLGLPEEAVQARWERPGRRVATAPCHPQAPRGSDFWSPASRSR